MTNALCNKGHVTYPSHTMKRLLLVEALGLLEEGLSLGALATNGLEALDVECLAGLHDGLMPATNGLGEVLLGPVGRFHGNNLSVLVLLEVGLLQATGSLGLGTTEHRGLCALTLGNDGLLHHAPLHALHGGLLHALLHGLLHGLTSLLHHAHHRHVCRECFFSSTRLE